MFSNAYLTAIWACRHFWLHLTAADLRSRWRGSYLGIFWSIIQPIALTALISIVFSRVFGSEIDEYAPYILSGVVGWDFLSSSFTGGSLTYVQAAPYIGQRTLPLAIYPLRTVLGCGVVLVMGCTALMLWVLFTNPGNCNMSWFSLFASIALLLLAA